MIKTFVSAIALAVENLKARLFHTLLSVLGIVIGVAALVSILCMIDGMEKFAKDQIQTTTSLNSIVLQSESIKYTNGLQIKKDTFAYFNYERFKLLKSSFDSSAVKLFIGSTSATELETTKKEKTGSLLIGIGEKMDDHVKLLHGRFFTSTDLINRSKLTLLNKKLLDNLGLDASSIGKQISTLYGELTIIGIVEEQSDKPKLYHPITLLSSAQLKEHVPAVWMEVGNVEEVNKIKTAVTQWIQKEFGAYANDITVVTNSFRLEQVERGFLLFRIIMGLIVGLSVVVGGIGVMNVLLISVTQRTTEIGVRKALGAKRKDIVLQFLAEAVTISAFGSFCGLVIGLLFTVTALPIIKSITKVPFQAAYTVDTLIIVSSLAILVGISFGTYPAIRASRLNPVEAIRRE